MGFSQIGSTSARAVGGLRWPRGPAIALAKLDDPLSTGHGVGGLGVDVHRPHHAAQTLQQLDDEVGGSTRIVTGPWPVGRQDGERAR